MSHSSFKLIANDEPMSQNLIIVVNKNGSVGTDTATLQNLLTSKDPPATGVTILRETSPTPSISDEMDEEKMEQLETLRQQYIDEHPNASEDEIEEHLKKEGANLVPHVTLSIENFYRPDQARKFANDVLHLGGIDKPQQLMPIDFNFRRKIIENDHCYTPLTQSPEPAEKSTAGKKKKDQAGLIKTMRREVKPNPKKIVEEENSDESEGASDEEVDEEQSAEEEEISFSESDDDNDMDFSVNDRFGKKGTKKKRKYRRHKQKNLTFKDFLLEGSNAADLSSMDEEPKKKYGKVAARKQAASQGRPSTSKASTSANTSKSSQQPSAKKIQAEKVAKNSPQQKFTPSSTFKAATTTASGNIGHISIQSAAPTKSIQEMEIVESIAKDLEKSFPDNSSGSSSAAITSTPVAVALKKSENIPNIMQILEPNTSAEVLDRSLSTLEHIDAADASASIEEIGDALIAVLGNEAIDELLNQNDLMNFDQSNVAIPTSKASTNVPQLQPMPLLTDTVTSPPTTPSTVKQPQTTPKILNKQAPQKDPVKIVKNGRVITLPAIEAPATRGAKRRAQGEPVTPVQANKTIKAEKTSPSKDPDSRNSSRRSSLNKSESRRQSTASKQAANEEEEANSDASWNSEDDPDRLWCICKQPHNNRFMICCDKCEEWFHGTCVNVTKAQGKIFEDGKKKWLCPNCKSGGVAKPDPNKKVLNQQKLTKFFSKHQKESTDEETPKTSLCVVCNKNSTRPDSIYCSDECIQNHATKHIDDASPKTPSQNSQKSEVKRGNILKNQEGNVIVYDKTTEKLLSTKLWPHISNLQQWLAANPNCEPVRPGSSKATSLMSSISNKKQLSTSLQTPTISSTTPPIKSQQSVDDLFSNPVKINTGNTPQTPPATASANKKLSRSLSMKSPPHGNNLKHVKSSSSIPSSPVASTPKRSEEKKLKRQASDEKISAPTSSKAKVELERQNIRNNFKNTLEARMKDFEHPTIAKMSSEEIEKFARHLESEMFLFFNRDTKEKYKNKFRSLKFNLSDVKNKTLIERICAKKVSPKQLVTLSPAELASEELAKWREDENKHQLEIITKSELDALSQNKIVVKTHKGEEIIETNPTPTEILMPGVDDDIESAISKTVLSLDDSHGRHDKSPLSSPSISSSTSRGGDHHHHHHSHHHKSSSSSKHKRRSRSRSRSRGRDRHKHHSSSREKSRNRSKHRDDKHRDKSKSNDTDSKSSSSKGKESNKKSSHHSHHSHHSSSSNHHHEKEKVKEQPKEKKPLEIKPEQEDVDLVGKILDSMGVHLDMQPKKEEPESVEKKKVETLDQPSSSTEVNVEPINEHQLEIEIYSGSMYMADVATFPVTASTVSGKVDDIMKKFSPTMEVVGRIEPKTVCDYLEKVKKLPGKELVVLRFSSSDESSYFQLFNYLHSRQRYGVIKSSCSAIKDFYLITVEANRSLPPVLLPIVDGPGFIEGEEHKPDLLLGVILKITPESKHMKKPTKESVKKSNKPSRAPVEHNVPIEILPSRHKSHHSHHHQSSSSKLVMGLPEIDDEYKESSPTPSDDDEPYEPVDEDVNALIGQSSSSTKLNTSDDLESQMEQINREIERRQMEIQRLAQQKAMELDEAEASKIFEKISVPHNLSEILSTIKASAESKPMEIDDDDDDEYVPVATSTQSNAEYRASYGAINPPIVNSMMDIDERINLFRAQEMAATTAAQPSRLASMSDADLLKLVPDNSLEMAAPPPPVISSSSGNKETIPGLEYDSMEQ